MASHRVEKNSSDTLLNIILSLLLPPAAVYRLEGMSEGFWLCVLLTLMVVIPGQIYALVVTVFSGGRPPKDPHMIEIEPEVVVAPRPKRVIAVTPDYMDNSSQTDLATIISSAQPVSPPEEKRPTEFKQMEGIQVPSAIRSGGSDVSANQIRPFKTSLMSEIRRITSLSRCNIMKFRRYLAIFIIICLSTYGLYLGLTDGGKKTGKMGELSKKASSAVQKFTDLGKPPNSASNTTEAQNMAPKSSVAIDNPKTEASNSPPKEEDDEMVEVIRRPMVSSSTEEED